MRDGRDDDDGPGLLTATRAESGVSGQAWSALINAACDAVFVADARSGEIVDCNEAAERLCGRTRNDLIGAHQTSLHPPGEAERYRAEFTRYARSGHGMNWHSEIIDCAGRRIPVEISSGVAEVDGRRLIMGVFRDIRERRRSATELRESERQLQEAVAGAPVPIMLHADDGTVLMLSREWTRITGYAPEEIRTLDDWMRLAYGPDAAQPRERVNELYERQGPALQGEFSIRTACQGEARLWKFYASPLGRLPDGRRLMLSMAVDVTDYRQSEAQRQQGVEKLQRALSDAVEAMARAMAKRDPYTAGHQDRVAELSAALARELGLDTEQARGLHMGAGIHDVGKIYVPSEILNRPGRLSAAEMAIIHAHCEVGHDIVKHIEFPWPVADIILQHHERLDGSGYPQGLKGQEICLEARILAVADTVEAMSSYRPYRPSLGIDAALAEIERNRGRLYDSDVVGACLNLFRHKGFELPG